MRPLSPFFAGRQVGTSADLLAVEEHGSSHRSQPTGEVPAVRR